MMIFGYEVGSTKVVVIGRSNWVQDSKTTRKVQKNVQKRECVGVLYVSSLSCSQSDNIFGTKV